MPKGDDDFVARSDVSEPSPLFRRPKDYRPEAAGLVHLAVSVREHLCPESPRPSQIFDIRELYTYTS